MPKYQVRDGHKLVVTDPDHPGQTLDKLGGAHVDLTEDEAAQYAEALTLVSPATADTAEVAEAIKAGTAVVDDTTEHHATE